MNCSDETDSTRRLEVKLEETSLGLTCSLFVINPKDLKEQFIKFRLKARLPPLCF